MKRNFIILLLLLQYSQLFSQLEPGEYYFNHIEYPEGNKTGHLFFISIDDTGAVRPYFYKLEIEYKGHNISVERIGDKIWKYKSGKELSNSELHHLFPHAVMPMSTDSIYISEDSLFIIDARGIHRSSDWEYIWDYRYNFKGKISGQIVEGVIAREYIYTHGYESPPYRHLVRYQAIFKK